MSVQAKNANEQLVLEFFEVLSSGDLEELRRFYHDQSVWEPKVKDIAGAGKHVGMDIIDKFLAPVRGMFNPGDPKVHVRGALNNGLSKEEIREVLLQVGIYAGIPAAVDSFRIANEAFAEIDAEGAKELG